MKRVLLFIIIAVTSLAYLSYSQAGGPRLRDARAQIELLLSKYKNGVYKEIGEVIDVDSSIGVRGISNGRISDPYGTLKRCYLFLAATEEAGKDDRKRSIGIYRDNQIIWMSAQLPGSENYGYIDEDFIATKDLSRTGKVDIVVYFSDGTNPPSEHYLWIFSWDGSNGKCINKCNKNGETSIVSSGAFEIIDVDGDGIDEIQSFTGEQKKGDTYFWNGSLYEKKSSASVLKGRKYTVANNFTAIFSVVVTRDGEKFKYSYKVKNNQGSKQKIEWISIGETNNLIDTIIAPSDWKGGQWSDRPIVQYRAKSNSIQLSAGSQAEGFMVRCYGLPVISKFYLQAPSIHLDLSSKSSAELTEEIYQDILNNSFTGFTISAGNPLSPFVPLNFLGTLSSYTTQSRTLGWIKDQATANKYLGYFASAKTSLQQNNIDSTRIKLQQILSDVNIDSTANLMSEAYALLRYNTEYLLEHLSIK